MALDPHKTLFLPYGTGAVVARDGRQLFDAFSASADYIQPLGESGVGPSPADLSPELTRHFRACGLWLPLQLAGVAAFRAAQSEKIRLARYFHARLSALADWDAGPGAGSFGGRLPLSAAGDADAFNDRLLRPHPGGGAGLCSAARASAARPGCAARSCRSAPILAHIDEIIDVLVRAAAALQSE